MANPGPSVTTSSCASHPSRPPASVYEEIEDAIRHALAGNLTAEIESRDGRGHLGADLLERWEPEELLQTYARPPDDPDYRD